MSSTNVLIATGHLGKDPEERETRDGTVMATFSIAISGRNDSTTWLDCVTFGNQAEAVLDNLVKGDQITIQGELQQRTWEDDDGNRRQSYSVRVWRADFLNVKSFRQRKRDEEEEDEDRPQRRSRDRDDERKPRRQEVNDDFSDEEDPFKDE